MAGVTAPELVRAGRRFAHFRSAVEHDGAAPQSVETRRNRAPNVHADAAPAPCPGETDLVVVLRITNGIFKDEIIRPGLIVGPYDPSGRFTYWPIRIARGGTVLAPAPPDRPAQFTHGRELADGLVRLAAGRNGGRENERRTVAAGTRRGPAPAGQEALRTGAAPATVRPNRPVSMTLIPPILTQPITPPITQPCAWRWGSLP